MPSLYSAARSWTRQPDEANDVVQETYLRAYRTFSNFQPGTNCKAWLFKILHSVIVNRYKSERRQPDTLESSDLEERFNRCLTRSETDWDRRMVQQTNLDWTAEEVRSALDRLPRNFLEAVTLVDIEELSYEEAAQSLDCPVGTLRSRLFRARKFLFAELQEYARRSGYQEVGK